MPRKVARVVACVLLESGFYEFEGFRGWVSPKGEKHEVPDIEDHGRQAAELLKRYYPSWDWEANRNFFDQGVYYPTYALQFKGWVRVVGTGIFSTWELSGQAYNTVLELIAEIAAEDPEKEITVGTYLGRGLRGTAQQLLNEL